MTKRKKEAAAEGGEEGAPPKKPYVNYKILTPEKKAKRDAKYAELLREAAINDQVLFPAWAAARFMNVEATTLADARRKDEKTPSGESIWPKYVRVSKHKVNYRYCDLVDKIKLRTFQHTSAEPGAPARPDLRRVTEANAAADDGVAGEEG